MKETGHWYFRDGTLCTSIPSRDGWRSPTLRDARRGVRGMFPPYGIVPSVTTILHSVGVPLGLARWMVETTIECAATMPRKDGEDAEQYAARLREDADRWRRDAAALGTRVHAAITRQLRGVSPEPEDAEVTDIVGPAVDFIRSMITRVRAVEKSFATVVYGGTYDLLADGPDDLRVLIDIKTQGTHQRYGHIPRPYDEWGEQLAAYADANRLWPCRLLNVIISTTKPGVVVAHEWDDATRLLQQWQCKLRYYRLTRNWWPERSKGHARLGDN